MGYYGLPDRWDVDKERDSYSQSHYGKNFDELPLADKGVVRNSIPDYELPGDPDYKAGRLENFVSYTINFFFGAVLSIAGLIALWIPVSMTAPVDKLFSFLICVFFILLGIRLMFSWSGLIKKLTKVLILFSLFSIITILILSTVLF